MPLFSFHLLETTPATTLAAMGRPPRPGEIAGLRHAECLATMTLGSPLLSLARLQLRRLAVMACWEEERALDDFLANTPLGHQLAGGWHLRLQLLRQWGTYAPLRDLSAEPEAAEADQPVVALTLARLRLSQVFRFLRWGKPVERLVRDHPGTTLALAAFRPPRTFSTFSIWRSQRAMTDMVHGRDAGPGADRHAQAMQERARQDFHWEFTTLRFRALAEHGQWGGQTGWVPTRDTGLAGGEAG